MLLGASHPDGLPPDLFNTGAARWLGVQVQVLGAPEQPRILLVSVPYAMKAGDAETLGGKPLSSFVLAQPTGKSGALRTSASRETTAAINNGTPANGTANHVAKFDSACTSAAPPCRNLPLKLAAAMSSVTTVPLIGK